MSTRYGRAQVLLEAQARGIKELLHFTTNRGLTGILATKRVMPRSSLSKDKYLELIVKPNSEFRKDGEWLNFVNLSISRVNSRFFAISATNWHANEDLWWCILAFSPELLAHDGVYFTTTNNIYTGVVRGQGIDGFRGLFGDRVHQYLGRYAQRGPDHNPAFTTCEQAEVLYPGSVSTEYLNGIYVDDDQHAAVAEGIVVASGHSGAPVIVASELFWGLEH